MNVLIIGFGSIAKKHIQALDALNVTATIYALRSEKDAQTHEGIINLHALSDVPDDIDFVIVSTPTSIHLQSIKDALTLKKPLFIEKPVVRYTKEIDELLSSTKEAGVPTYTACVLRHHPCLQYVKDSLSDRTIQKVQAYCGSYMPEWVPGKDFTKSFRADAAMSGGVHLELIHELDYCYWLFGAPKNIHSTLKKSGELGIDIIDDASYELSYSEFTAHINVNYLDKEAKRFLEIRFEDSTWNVDLLNFRIEEDGEEIFSSEMSFADLYASQMQYFLNCLHEGANPMNSVREASQVLTLALS
ncbi:MAG: oxidoreductase [Flammeovirgaceae bacterium]|nr:oxidoreductase [Flammeovirgaceae bacterium]|tara:strand:- start:7485 stop:8390 length:906 start_codon:yes stop_codon:yes gene_type:complete